MENPMRLLRINGFQTTLEIKFYIRCMIWRRVGEYQILLTGTFMGGKGTSLWHILIGKRLNLFVESH